MGRSTRDVVTIVLAVTAAACLFAALVGLLTIELVHPETDTTGALDAVWSIVAAVVGLVAGYVLSRLVSRD